MKVTIFGATGGVGRHAMEQALAAGHEVTAVVRKAGGLPDTVRILTVGDLMDPDRAVIEESVRHADGVLSGLGPRSKADARNGIVLAATSAIVNAMKETGASRLIVISAVPVGTTASPARREPVTRDPGDDWLTRAVMTPLIKAFFKDTYADLAAMEDVVRDSGLDWTIVRPPRLLDKKLTGVYRTDGVQNLPNGRAISRADVAHFMVNALEQPGTIGQAVRIAY